MAFLVVFFLIPFLLALKISLAKAILAVPPFTEMVVQIHEGTVIAFIHTGNYNILDRKSVV